MFFLLEFFLKRFVCLVIIVGVREVWEKIEVIFFLGKILKLARWGGW